MNEFGPASLPQIRDYFGKATLPQIRDYFGMSSTEFKTEWLVLDDAERDFFKVGVGEVLGLTA